MTWTTKSPKVRMFLDRVAIEEAQIRSRIKQARLLAGLNQQQAADLLHVHKRTWENWERAVVEVPYGQLDEIASKLGKTSEWLLHGDDYIPVSQAQETIRETLVRELEPLRKEIEELQNLLRASGSGTQ